MANDSREAALLAAGSITAVVLTLWSDALASLAATSVRLDFGWEIAGALTGSMAVLRVAAATPLVLLLPGYLLVRLLLPGKGFSFATRLMLSLGASVVLTIFGGLLLNLTPFGLRAGSWAALLGLVCLAGCATLAVRGRRHAATPIAEPPMSRDAKASRAPFPLRHAALLALAAVVLVAAGGVAVASATGDAGAGFTQLWILPPNGSAGQGRVRLGVENDEGTAMEYSLALSVDGVPVRQWTNFVIAPGQTWQANAALPNEPFGSSQQVQAILYRADAPTQAYRHVSLWVTMPQPAPPLSPAGPAAGTAPIAPCPAPARWARPDSCGQ